MSVISKLFIHTSLLVKGPPVNRVMVTVIIFSV